MADVAKKPTLDAPEHKIRMTLTSTNVKALEKGLYSIELNPASMQS